jgi:hypothetical protein
MSNNNKAINKANKAKAIKAKATIKAKIAKFEAAYIEKNKMPYYVIDEYNEVKAQVDFYGHLIKVLPWTKETVTDAHGITWKVCNFKGKKEYIYWDKDNNRVWRKKGDKMKVHIHAGLGSKSEYDNVIVIKKRQPHERYEGQDDQCMEGVEFRRFEAPLGETSQKAFVKDKAIKKNYRAVCWLYDESENKDRGDLTRDEFWGGIEFNYMYSKDSASDRYDEYCVSSRRVYGVIADSIANAVAKQWEDGDPIYTN